MNRNPISEFIFSRKVNDMISQKRKNCVNFNQYQVSCTIIDTNQILKKNQTWFCVEMAIVLLSANHSYAAEEFNIGYRYGRIGFDRVSVEALFNAAKAVLKKLPLKTDDGGLFYSSYQ